MFETTTVIVGAGQAGLAMSWHLRERGIDHVVLERSEIAHAWRHERWDSLRLLTPNWLSRLPGNTYTGADPDGYMTAAEVADRLCAYGLDAPVEVGVEVLKITSADGRHEVSTSQGTWICDAVVVATGACTQPFIPALSERFDPSVTQLASIDYRRPDLLPSGPVLVVGASASGAQIADELARNGRDAVLAIGRHRRMIREYRGRDIFWWMEQCGMLDDVPDPLNVEGERQLPSLQLVGSDPRRDLDLGTLVANGVQLVGRIESIDGSIATLGTSVAVDARNADVELDAILRRIDAYATEQGLDDDVGPPVSPPPVAIPEMPERLDLSPFTVVIWATGFKPHHPYLESDLVDGRGGIVHEGGVMRRPGMYVLGQPFGRRRRSSFIDGAGPDAEDLSALLAAHVERQA